METEKKSDTVIIYNVHEVVRSASIGLLLIVFAATKLPYLARRTAELNMKQIECSDITQVLCEWGFCFDSCTTISQALSAFAIMVAALSLIIIFSIVGVAIYANPQTECGQKASGTAFITMLAMVFGGLGWMIGYCDMMNIALQSDDTIKSRPTFHWWLAVWFFEFYLGAITASLFGINCYFRMADNKTHRIFGVLIQLCIVSCALFICYTYIAVQRAEIAAEYIDDLWTLPLIAAGYAVILVSALSFVVFWFLTRNEKNSSSGQEIVKNIICVCMIIGSLLTAIGFWAEFNAYDPHNNTLNSWNTAYCVLLIGLCVYNATDLRNSEPFKYDTVPKQEE